MIELYNLDSCDYADLSAKMTGRIPRFSRNWTNFNPSEPGITIIELLCYVTETLLYRTNRVPEESWLNFLRLVAGATRSRIDELLSALTDKKVRIEYRIPDLSDKKLQQTMTFWIYPDQPYIDLLLYLRELESGTSATVSEMQKKVLTFLSLPSRAVSETDFHQLPLMLTSGEKAIKTTAGVTMGTIPEWAAVSRTWADVSDNRVLLVLIAGMTFTYLEQNCWASSTCSVWTRDTSNDVRYQTQYERLVIACRSYMLPRLVVGTVLDVQAPEWTPVYLEITFRCSSFADPAKVVPAVRQKVILFLDPVEGGADGKGWPYNEPVTPASVSDVVKTVDGVSSVAPTVRVNETLQVGVDATVGLTCLLGVTPSVERTGSYFRGLPRMEQLIINTSEV